MGNNSKKEEMRYLDKLVSIVVPVHNAEKYLSKTIESVRAQTYPDWELILVDDCSKDGTSELYETLLEENIIVIKLPTNSGRQQQGIPDLPRRRADIWHSWMQMISGDRKNWSSN